MKPSPKLHHHHPCVFVQVFTKVNLLELISGSKKCFSSHGKKTDLKLWKKISHLKRVTFFEEEKKWFCGLDFFLAWVERVEESLSYTLLFQPSPIRTHTFDYKVRAVPLWCHTFGFLYLSAKANARFLFASGPPSFGRSTVRVLRPFSSCHQTRNRTGIVLSGEKIPFSFSTVSFLFLIERKWKCLVKTLLFLQRISERRNAWQLKEEKLWKRFVTIFWTYLVRTTDLNVCEERHGIAGSAFSVASHRLSRWNGGCCGLGSGVCWMPAASP